MSILETLISGILLLVVTVSHPSVTGSDSTWALVREDETIHVFKRSNSDGYKDIRIEATFQAEMDDLIELLNDVDSYPDWVYKCDGAEEIGSTNSGFLRYWMVTDFPFPFKDRELVILSHSYIDDYGVYHSSSHAEVGKLKNDENILVDKFDSQWIVRNLGAGMIGIEYEVSARPGGIIPPWLYNLAVDHGPFKTMEALREKVEKRS